MLSVESEETGFEHILNQFAPMKTRHNLNCHIIICYKINKVDLHLSA